MKTKDIVVGGKYIAKVSGRLTTVRVLNVREVTTYSGASTRDRKCFDVVNMATGRKTTFRSAAKFRSIAPV